MTINEYIKDEQLGFKIGPFEIDRVNAETFSNLNMYDMIYQSDIISEILANRDQFQLVIGYPGTGKTLILLTLRHYVNQDFLEANANEMAVYVDLVEQLPNIKDWNDEYQHRQLFLNKIIAEIIRTFLGLLQEKLDYFEKTKNKNGEKEIKEILSRFQGKSVWSKVKKVAKSILKVAVITSLKNKLGIDLDAYEEFVKDTEAKDISEVIEAIVDSTEHKINSIILLFDEIGEYTKQWNSKKLSMQNTQKYPSIMDILFAIKNTRNVISKVSCYEENYEIFLDYGFEFSHLHPTFLDPDLKNKQNFSDEMYSYSALLKNMILKRIEYLSTFRTNGSPYIQLYTNKPSSELGLFENDKIIDAVAFLSNFNPRISLSYLKTAWRLAKRTDNNPLKFTESDYPTGHIIALKTGNQNLKEAFEAVATARERGVRGVVEKTPLSEKFFTYLLLNGANYFTIPKLVDSSIPNLENFKTLFEELVYPRRVFIKYQSSITYKDESRTLYGIESPYLYSLISRFQNREELKQSKDFQRLKNNYLQYFSRLQGYFNIYHITIEDIQNGFLLHSEMATIISQIKELKREQKKIRIKLETPGILDEEEEKLEADLKNLRKDIRDLREREEKIKEEAEKVEKEVVKEYQEEHSAQEEYIDEYGRSEIEEAHLQEIIYEKIEKEDVKVNRDELNEMKKKFMFQFSSSIQNVQKIADAILESLISSKYLVEKKQLNFTSNYIKISPNGLYHWYWKILVQKTISQLNLYLNLSKNPTELNAYTSWYMANYAGNYLHKFVFYDMEDFGRFRSFFISILKKILDEQV